MVVTVVIQCKGRVVEVECVRVCVCACVRAFVRARARVCVCVSLSALFLPKEENIASDAMT